MLKLLHTYRRNTLNAFKEINIKQVDKFVKEKTRQKQRVRFYKKQIKPLKIKPSVNKIEIQETYQLAH